MRNKKKKDTAIHHPDYIVAGLVLGLTIFGVLMVYNTSLVVAFEDFNDKYHYLKNQGMWAMIGITASYIVSHIDYHYWKQWARPLFFISLVLLVLVLIPGFSADVLGARRRITLPEGVPVFGGIGIQPSEIAKFSVVLYLATWLSEAVTQKNKKMPLSSIIRETVTPFVSILGLIIGLVMLEPDLGTSIIIAGSAFIVYFLSGVPIISLVIVGTIIVLGATGFAFSSTYRRNRILAFLNPEQGSTGISYHINQIMIALGSGGLLGVGLGHSRQKYQYLPEVTTDSIFAVIGEELGFVGALLVIFAFLFLIWRGFIIVEQSKDMFGKLLAAGIIAIISMQSFLNLTSMVAITPLTGVPLPFISYGGSSLTMLLVSIGVLLNISKHTNKT